MPSKPIGKFNFKIVVEGQAETKKYLKDLTPRFDNAVDNAIEAVKTDDAAQMVAEINNIRNLVAEFHNHKIFDSEHTMTSFANYFTMIDFDLGIGEAREGNNFIKELAVAATQASDWVERDKKLKSPKVREMVKSLLEKIAANWDGTKENFEKMLPIADRIIKEVQEAQQ